MTRDARFEAVTTRWTEAFQHAQALCSYLAGSTETDHDHELLALAHRAIVDEEDPLQFLVELTPGTQREAALAMSARPE